MVLWQMLMETLTLPSNRISFPFLWLLLFLSYFKVTGIFLVPLISLNPLLEGEENKHYLRMAKIKSGLKQTRTKGTICLQ